MNATGLHSFAYLMGFLGLFPPYLYLPKKLEIYMKMSLKDINIFLGKYDLIHLHHLFLG